MPVQLNEDCIIEICRYLTPRSVARLKQCSRELQSIALTFGDSSGVVKTALAKYVHNLQAFRGMLAFTGVIAYGLIITVLIAELTENENCVLRSPAGIFPFLVAVNESKEAVVKRDCPC